MMTYAGLICLACVFVALAAAESDEIRVKRFYEVDKSIGQLFQLSYRDDAQISLC
jgi:hypothetical protein